VVQWFSGSVPIAQLRIPVAIPTLGRTVKNGPQRHQVRLATRVLARVCGGAVHFAAPKVAKTAIAACKNIEGRHVRIVRSHVVPGEVTLKVAVQLEVVPAPLLLDRQQPLNG